MKPPRTVGLVMLAAVAVGVLWMAVASPMGDLRGHWTDHLRHQGEALALVEEGPDIYLATYDQAMASVKPPCSEHLGLWGHVGIPYPPVALLLHLPLAEAERSGLLTPANSHRAQVLLALLAGLGAAALALHLARRNRLTSWWVLLWFGPMVVGAGACGMYDSFYVLAIVLALEGSATNGSRGAWVWRGVAGALHVRGLFALALGVRLRPAASLPRWVYAFVVAALLPTLAVAATVGTHAAGFPLDNRLHITHKGWLLIGLSVGTLAAMHRWGNRRLMLPLLAATVLMLVDPQTAWWHLLPSALVPLGILGDPGDARRGQLTSLMSMAWVVTVSFLYLVSPWPAPVFWLTIG